MLTQKRLKELLSYDDTTGIFTWLERASIRVTMGRRAGSRDSARRGYIRIRIDRVNYLAHRLAWFYVYGVWPTQQIDHINRDKADNRIKNLRDVSRRENARNVGLRSNSTSGVSGVCWDARRQRWLAHIRIDGKQKQLGRFTELSAAVTARKAAEIKVSA